MKDEIIYGHLKLVYRQRCSGIFVKPPCGASFSRRWY